MTVIRPLTAADLPAAVAVFDARLGSGRGVAEPALMDSFTRTLFENPWADPELPSLVAEDDTGAVVGMITVGARRMRLGERPVRLAVLADLCVTPEAERTAAGVRLLQHALRGPQDASISDTASDAARRIWLRLGGSTVPISAITWVRLFGPWRTGLLHAGARTHRRGDRRVPHRAAAALDRATARAWSRAAAPPAPALGEREPLTPENLIAALPAVGRGLALVPDYDAAYAAWLLAELERVRARGELVAQAVWRGGAAGRRVAGYFVYHLRPGRRSDVLAVAAGSEADTELVLDHLLDDAHRRGAAMLRGRMEPRLASAVIARGCLLSPSSHALLSTGDAELARAVLAGDALLTRMEGEWAGPARLIQAEPRGVG